jgi:hypothetical protein
MLSKPEDLHKSFRAVFISYNHETDWPKVQPGSSLKGVSVAKETKCTDFIGVLCQLQGSDGKEMESRAVG